MIASNSRLSTSIVPSRTVFERLGWWGRSLLRKYRNEIRRVSNVRELAARNPLAEISGECITLGDPSNISIGSGSLIEAGVVFDMRHGGNISLGERTTLRRGAILSPYGGSIRMGCECGVNHYTVVYGHGGFTCGNLVRFAAHCVVIPANHGVAVDGTPIYKQPLTRKGIRMGNDIWVGAGAQLLDGINVADGAVIAAGAVVNIDVPERWIVGGVPAKQIRRRE